MSNLSFLSYIDLTKRAFVRAYFQFCFVFFLCLIFQEQGSGVGVDKEAFDNFSWICVSCSDDRRRFYDD